MAKLTDRQVAVLAAIERHGNAADIHELRRDFPDMAPSAIVNVCEALERKGRIRSSEVAVTVTDSKGRETIIEGHGGVYLGGVRWSTS